MSILSLTWLSWNILIFVEISISMACEHHKDMFWNLEFPIYFLVHKPWLGLLIQGVLLRFLFIPLFWTSSLRLHVSSLFVVYIWHLYVFCLQKLAKEMSVKPVHSFMYLLFLSQGWMEISLSHAHHCFCNNQWNFSLAFV